MPSHEETKNTESTKTPLRKIIFVCFVFSVAS
jgi:hypothetical protein